MNMFAQGNHPLVDSHPNLHAFIGVLTVVDSESESSPSGARGHRVVLTRAAAEAAMPTLLGMAVDYRAGWQGHDVKQKCGIITSAHLDGKEIIVEGYVFKHDFPEMLAVSLDKKLGMSYEMHEAHIEDMRASVWTITRCTFIGAAVLIAEKAAYKNTSFALA